MQYQLNFNIGSDVKKIHDLLQSITIVKNVTGDPLGSGNLQVAWVTFSPLMGNQVSWSADYYIYASTTSVQSGATIKMTSQTDAPAQLGPIYDFAEGVFTTTTQGAATTYNAQNDYGQSLTFGLAQQASINGAKVMAPLSATPIGNTQQGTFTPSETVSIYLSSYSDNGVVISQVAGDALTVKLTSQQPVANIGFTAATNSFYLAGQSSTPLSFTDLALGSRPALAAPSQKKHA